MFSPSEDVEKDRCYKGSRQHAYLELWYESNLSRIGKVMGPFFLVKRKTGIKKMLFLSIVSLCALSSAGLLVHAGALSARYFQIRLLDEHMSEDILPPKVRVAFVSGCGQMSIVSGIPLAPL